MKKLSLLLLVVVILFGKANAQMQLADISIYEGLSPLSSGLGAVVNLVDTTNQTGLNLEFNSTLAQVVYTKESKLLTYGPSIGTQDNCPWIAPLLVIKATDWLTVTTWNGIFFGKPNKADVDINFGFAYQSIDLFYGNLGVGYAVLHFLEYKPMNLPNVGYNFFIGKNNSIKTSYTYNVRDDSPMFFVKWTYEL